MTPIKMSCDNSTTVSLESHPSPTSQDTELMQQLLLEQQKQQTLLLNQQELLMGLQEGHKELMEKVQHKEAIDSHNSEREWWIKKLLQQSSVSNVPNRNDALRSQSFPNLGNSSQPHLIGHKGASVLSSNAIGQAVSNEKSILNNGLSFKETSGEVKTILESTDLSAQASVAVEACADSSPTHSPTYQSCGTNTHNLVDTGVNTGPLTIDICVGTEWSISSSSSSSSSSEEELEKSSKTETSPQAADSPDTSSRTVESPTKMSPQAKDQPSPTTTEKEPQSEDFIAGPSQPQATSSSPENSSYLEIINQEVLARSVDGYYYWGVVLHYDHQQDLFIVEDLDSRQQLMMSRADFVTEMQDAPRRVLQLYDRALAPRILFPNCFLPGRRIPIN